MIKKDSKFKRRWKEIKRNGIWVNIAGLVPLVWGLALVFMMVWGLNVALADPQTYLDKPYDLVMGKYTINNFLEVATKFKQQVSGSNGVMRWIEYPEMLLNSFTYALGCTFMNLISTVLFSYATARYEFKGKKFLYAFIMVQMMIPMYGQEAAKYKLMTNLNMVDNVFYYLSQGAGHGAMFLVFYAYFRSIPREYDEAAKIDGAGPFAIFKSIMLPFAFPIITAQGIMTFITYWNDYATVMIYQKTHPTLSSTLYMLRQYMFYIGLQTPTYFAGIFLSIVPVVLLFAIFNKKLMSNVTAGGIKG